MLFTLKTLRSMTLVVGHNSFSATYMSPTPSFFISVRLCVVDCASTRMPSYQFNNFTGRLKESKHLQPLYPLSATRLESSDPPKMIYDTIKTKPVVASNVRAASGGVLPAKMLKTMAEYQKNIDTPVYIIRGTPDKILFGLTVALTAVGLGMAVAFVASQASPPKLE